MGLLSRWAQEEVKSAKPSVNYKLYKAELQCSVEKALDGEIFYFFFFAKDYNSTLVIWLLLPRTTHKQTKGNSVVYLFTNPIPTNSHCRIRYL